MRLTNTLRDAFVRAAMDDVPNIDIAEAVRAKALKLAVAALPPKVKAIWNDPALRHFVALNHYTIGQSHGYSYRVGVALPLPAGAAEAVIAQVDPMIAEKKKSDDLRDGLRARLKGVAYGQSTRAGLLAALPEFKKYLPADEAAAIRSLPAIANVVADFVKAGWPAGKPAKETT